MGIQSWNIETGEQTGGVSPHALTHHQGETDAISAEEIGAEVEGVAQGLIITHISEPNPHIQYRPRNEGIPFSHIVGAPTINPPILNFVPFNNAEWTIIQGILPTTITISDPPEGNNGAPCYQFSAGSRAYLNPWYQLPSGIQEAYRVTLFARAFAANSMALAAGFYRINTIGSAVMGPDITLWLTPHWQQYDIHITNLNSTNASLVTMYCFCNGTQGQFAQVYGPQFSKAT